MSISDRTTIYHRDGTSVTLPIDEARNRTYFQPEEWSLIKPPPLNWQFEVPRYKVTRDLKPAQKHRFTLERPFSEMDSDYYQYGERLLAAKSEISTTNWPHASMTPLTYGAEKILEFFKARMKSRLPLRPWRGGRIDLDDGLTGPGRPDVRPIKPAPFDMTPRPAA